jgi:hypothetical protein
MTDHQRGEVTNISKNGLKAMLAILAILIASVSLLAATRSYVKAADPTAKTVSQTPTALSSYGTVVLSTAAVTTGAVGQIIVGSSIGPFYVEKLIINQAAVAGRTFTALYARIDLTDVVSGRLKSGAKVCFLAAFATSNTGDFGPPADLIGSMSATGSGSSLLVNSPLAGLSIETGVLVVNLFGDSSCNFALPAIDTLLVQVDVVAPSSATVSLSLSV